MSATKEHLHDQIEAGQRKQHPIGWLNMPGFKPETWNPIVGCTKVSPACNDCFAERMANRLSGMPKTAYYKEVITNGKWNGKTHLAESQLTKPLQWKSPRMIFTVDMGDLFHESVPFEWIDSVFSIMSDLDQHIYVLLTKRPERILEFFCWKILRSGYNWRPKNNIWFGVTAENQEQANIRIPLLLKVPCAIRLVSIEPMLSRINIAEACKTSVIAKNFDYSGVQKLHWVICGGESGPKARPMHPDWVRSLRDQCQSANVHFFFKQWGELLPSCQTPNMVFFGMHKKEVQFQSPHNPDKMNTYLKLGSKKSGDWLDDRKHHNWPNQKCKINSPGCVYHACMDDGCQAQHMLKSGYHGTGDCKKINL